MPQKPSGGDFVPVVDYSSWRDYAECRDTPPQDMNPHSSPDPERRTPKESLIIARLCAECISIEDCLADAIITDCSVGIKGGLTSRERKPLQDQYKKTGTVPYAEFASASIRAQAEAEKLKDGATQEALKTHQEISPPQDKKPKKPETVTEPTAKRLPVKSSPSKSVSVNKKSRDTSARYLTLSGERLVPPPSAEDPIQVMVMYSDKTVVIDGQRLWLTNRQMRVLELMLTYRHKPISKSDILPTMNIKYFREGWIYLSYKLNSDTRPPILYKAITASGQIEYYVADNLNVADLRDKSVI
ncbi:MAG TPA: WhiB family transcriptional regulator [Candidatus Saccharimonadales bacterium]|nr:WhiB family transcriptional regulator [Candidatus Saccharimonadales bacterium]